MKTFLLSLEIFPGLMIFSFRMVSLGLNRRMGVFPLVFRPGHLIRTLNFTAKIFILNTGSQYDVNNDAKKSSIRFVGLQEDWHLDLVKNKKWRVGPDFGFGFGIQRLKLYEKLYTPTNFAAALSHSVITHQEKKFNSAFYFINAGMGIDRKFKFREVDFYFGMGAGYRLSSPAGFSVKYQYDISSPNARLSGFQYAFKFRFEIRELIPSKKRGYEYRKFY